MPSLAKNFLLSTLNSKLFCIFARKITPNTNVMQQQRIVFIDYIRVIACFLVMLVHASENFYGADASGLAGNMSMLLNESNRFWVAFYDGGVARTCVPLFMVVSAFLLAPLPDGTSMTDFYLHRARRIIPPVLLFMIIYAFLPMAWGAITWEQAQQDLLTIPFNFTSMTGHLWFIYPLLSLYIIIPVISPWLRQASARDERIFLGFWVFSTFAHYLHLFVSQELWGECFWNRYGMFWYVSGFLGYLVMAHYIRIHLQWSRSKKLRIGTLCFLAGAAFTAWGFWMRGIPGQAIETPLLEWTWEFCTPNVALATFGAFLLFSCIQQKKAPSLITGVSKLTFGIYLMHMLFLAPIANAIIAGDAANPLLPVWLAIPVIAILSYLCCTLTTKLISLIPGHKWLIG